MTRIQWNEGFKRRRELHQISISVMAQFMQVDEGYLQRFEQGEVNLNIEQLEKACLLFNCSLAELSDDGLKNCFNAKEYSCETLEAMVQARKLNQRLQTIVNA